jgi:hypothetical protein
VTAIRLEREDADRMLRQVELLLNDLRPFWPLVVPLATGWWRMQFQTEGGFAGRPWAALSPGYAAWKMLHYPGLPILQLTGDMKRAASKPTRSVTTRSLTLTIEDDKIERHQTGTPRMPSRPLIFGDPLPPVARAELEAAADQYVGDFLRRF